MSKKFSVEQALATRRSHYDLKPVWVSPQSEVEQMLDDILRLVPTHYNTQGVRMVLLTGEAHRKHWELIEQILINRIGEDKYNSGTKDKIHNSFMSGVGTVIFFDEEKVTQDMINKFPTYKDNFSKWAEQVQGSHQLAVWIGLTQLGFGASLQHYIGMDDDAVRAQVGVPDHWRFVAHMPFGEAFDNPETKGRLPKNEVLIVKDK